MLFSAVLGHLALASAVCGAAFSVNSVDGNALRDQSLSERLGQRLKKIEQMPQVQGIFVASAELASHVKKVLQMIINELGEFIWSRHRCERDWNEMAPMLPWRADPIVKSYQQRDHAAGLCRALVESYRDILNHLFSPNVELLRELSPINLEAVVGFLTANIQVLEAVRRLEQYQRAIMPQKDALYRASTGNYMERIGVAIGANVREIGLFEEAICFDYENLARQMSESFGVMVDNTGKIIKNFEGDKRSRVYELLKQFLKSAVYFLYFEPPLKTMLEARLFEPMHQRRLGEAKAMLLIKICWRMRLFKSNFPDLDHRSFDIGILFWDQHELRADSFEQGPPLVRLDMIDEGVGMTLGELKRLTADFKVHGPELQKWLRTLRRIALSNSEGQESRAIEKCLLARVESNLGQMLDCVMSGEESTRLLVLGEMASGLAMLAVELEAALIALYGSAREPTRNVVGSEPIGSCPGHFLRQLEQAFAKWFPIEEEPFGMNDMRCALVGEGQ